MNELKGLFSPIKIKNLELKNRIVMPAMAMNFAGNSGEINDRYEAYMVERARGGAGLLIVEGSHVQANGRIFANSVRLWLKRLSPKTRLTL